jgi:hypothetical protein
MVLAIEKKIPAEREDRSLDFLTNCKKGERTLDKIVRMRGW